MGLRLGLVLLLIGALIAGTACAAPCDAPRPIRFASGATSGELRGGIARGDIGCLTIGARGGQRMRVAVSSVENNVVLQLYRPAWKIGRRDDGFAVAGLTLPGAGEDADARFWSGVLPVTGTYLLVLGTSRGGGEYRLRVRIGP